MGYHTYFDGKFEITPPLTEKDRVFLDRFSRSRRMKRKGLGKEFGVEGEWYVDGGDNFVGDKADASVADHNEPPKTQPGLWCQWTPDADGTHLVWDEGEKFYEFIPWLHYLIESYLKPRGYTLNGDVHWEGEENEDKGWIIVKKNKISTREMKEIAYYPAMPWKP